jgi:hypothetical protein
MRRLLIISLPLLVCFAAEAEYRFLQAAFFFSGWPPRSAIDQPGAAASLMTITYPFDFPRTENFLN